MADQTPHPPWRDDATVVHDEEELLQVTGAGNADTLAWQLFEYFDGAVHLHGEDGLTVLIGPESEGFSYPVELRNLANVARLMEAEEERRQDAGR